MDTVLLAQLEDAYLAARDARDRLDVARARGEPANTHDLEAAAADTERRVRAKLVAIGATSQDPIATGSLATSADEPAADRQNEDSRALDAIRAGVATALGEAGGLPVAPPATRAECDDAQAWTEAIRVGGNALRRRLDACYGAVAQALDVNGEMLNRLQVLARLAAEPDETRRRDLFLALDPLWRTVDGDGGSSHSGSGTYTGVGTHGGVATHAGAGEEAHRPSPYVALVRESAAQWWAGASPIAANAAALGVSEDEIEAWVVAILDAWRSLIVEPERATGHPSIEPWDWWWRAGAGRQSLQVDLPRDAILAVNRAVYASLGADIDALGIVLDVTPRASRPAVPVAFTTFGGRPGPRPDGGWSRGRPTVLATYVDGGLDELAELVHETGHAIHLAAIHARPAFTDWPASDALTEALADLVAHDVTDIAWQRRWLPTGTRVPNPPGIGAHGDGPGRDAVRARYAGTVLDAAWTLFEIRQHADPDRRPNDTWTEITAEWLGIAPHPEWSWWAMRGQLIQEPGYMANYAIGAVLSADMRQAIRAARGDWMAGDPGWYAWVSERLYRFGLERSPARVLGDLLGRTPTVDALLADMAGTARRA